MVESAGPGVLDLRAAAPAGAGKEQAPPKVMHLAREDPRVTAQTGV